MHRIATFVEKLPAHPNAEYYKVYPRSVRQYPGGTAFMAADEQGCDKLYSCGEKAPFEGLRREAGGTVFYECELSAHNAAVLRELFPFCGPQKVLSRKCTFGTGDRLGLATPGQDVYKRQPASRSASSPQANWCRMF